MSDTSSQTHSKPAAVPTAQSVVSEDSKDRGTVPERQAPDPTRYGDWEKNGRCIDF